MAVLSILPLLALAQTSAPTNAVNPLIDRLTSVGGASGFETDATKASTPIIIGVVVRAFIGFLGLTFIVLILIAGFKWMTASGNEETVKKATTTITNAVIGLVVALSAWSLWTFVLEKLILMK